MLSITVNTLVDEQDNSIVDGDISLRDAIVAASSGETIDFDAALDGGTISLTLGQMEITKSLTIDATSLAGGLTIDAGGNSRVFEVDDGDNTVGTSNVEISGLTLTGGSAAFSFGGAIMSQENLSIVDSVITANTAKFAGGGIWSNGPLLTVSGSSITNNSVVDVFNVGGGGIWTNGLTTITESTIADNTSADGGGGLFIDLHGDATISLSTISGNYAEANGGGIEAEYGNLTITYSQISGNSAGDSGGGIHAHEDLIVISSTLTENSAVDDGGGIDHREDSSFFSHPLTIIDSTISGNSSGDNGGGVRNTALDMSVYNSTISGNTAAGDGGGIAASFGVLSTSTVTGNYAGNNGGGLDFFARANVIGSIVAGNAAGGDAPDLNKVKIEYSVIGDNAGTSLIEAQTPDANGNLIGSSAGAGVIDPLLAALADNGGPTLTHALLPGSPAIDAGNPLFDDTAVPFDQRGAGFPRIIGAAVDMGAFELQSIPPEEQILSLLAGIEQLVDDDVLGAGQGNALSVKLDHVQQKLDSGQTHVALNLLDALVNQVDAFVNGGVLSPEQADPILDAIEALRESITTAANGEAAVDFALESFGLDDDLFAKVQLGAGGKKGN